METPADFRTMAARCRRLARTSSAQDEVERALLALAAEYDAHAAASEAETPLPERASLRLVSAV